MLLNNFIDQKFDVDGTLEVHFSFFQSTFSTRKKKRKKKRKNYKIDRKWGFY